MQNTHRIFSLFMAIGCVAAFCASASAQAPAQAAPPEAEKGATKDATKDATKKKWDVNNPPGEKDTVKLSTRTGTWMSVDVSPDGKQVVFDMLGDLYLLPIEGGDAKPLTTSIAWEMQPRFSPDGKRITFMSDAAGGDNIWVMDREGKNAREVTRESYRLLNNPVWHPNGQYIAARKHFTGTRSLGSGEIWLYHAGNSDKQDGVQLNEKPNWQKDLGEPAFSPDGRYLYYSQDTTPGTTFEYNKNSNTQIYQIMRRDLQQGKTIPFVSGPGGAIRPTPSPDGKYLAFVRRVRNQSTLFLKDLKSGEEAPVWRELDRDMQEAWAVHGVYPAFAWMPGSKEIVVWAQGKIWRVNPFTKDSKTAAKEIPFRIEHTREIRKALRYPINVAPDTFDVHQLRWVNVAPQGDRVVYSALGHIYVKRLTGKAEEQAPVRLTKQNTHFEFFPRFSRDGQRIVFTTWNDESQGSVRVFDLKTNKETTLTEMPGQFTAPTFSTDGKTVAYVKARGGFLTSPLYGFEPGVYVIAADGTGNPRIITEDGGAPQWAGDSNQLHITRFASQNEVDWTTSLVRINLTTREEQVLARSDMANEFALSPDGAWLAFRERFQTNVMPMPLAGRTVTVNRKGTALPVKQLSVNAGDYLHWSGDSRTVYFSLGDELFSRQLKDTFNFVDGAANPLPAISENGTKIGFKATADKPSVTTVISGAKIVTMRGDEVIENGRIVVRGNRIAAIGRAADIAVPAGATTVDAKGKTIIPGLVDAHWHGAMGAGGIIPQQSWVNYASLAFGVTTIHDPSNDTSSIFTVSEMQRTGRVVGPRIFSTGTILYGAKATITAEVNGLGDALTHLKRMKEAGAYSVKSYNQPRRDQRQQVLEAARQTKMMVVPEGGSLFQHNMNMIIDGHTGIEHAIPVANAYDDVLQLWSQTKVGYTPTFNVAYGGLDGDHYWYARTDVWRHPLLSKYVPRSILEPRAVRRLTAPEEDFNILKVAKLATDIQRKGVPVMIGAHGQREGLGAHWEMWILAKGGMTPLEIIRVATLNGAKHFGMEGDIGSLDVGKLADLVIIDADILKDIYQSDKITHVMQNGRLFEAATMNEIGATPRARKPFFFERAGASFGDVGDDRALGIDHSKCMH
jgi:imidazolonepropionase-like amidohydrolase/Tol biopolymer transport system component